MSTARSEADTTDRHAVLLTGVYGSGKTSVAAEMANELERRGMPYAAIDLDWLRWFDVGWDDRAAARRVICSRAGSSAAGDAIPGTVMPSAS